MSEKKLLNKLSSQLSNLVVFSKNTIIYFEPNIRFYYYSKQIKGTASIDSFKKDRSNEQVNFEKISQQKLSNYLLNFVNTLSKQLPAEDLNVMNHNINNLKIIQNGISSLALKCCGISQVYSNSLNTIVSNTSNDKTSDIYHELFHMASSEKSDDKNKVYSGFSQEDSQSKEIGRGLTEGYTELLRERYFPQDKYYFSNSYKYVLTYAQRIEQIVGKEKMTSLYLNHNLSGLIAELEKYSSKDEILSFINNTDYIILDRVGNFTGAIGREKYIKSNFSKTNDFLISTYANKVSQEDISQEDKIAKVNYYKDSLNDSQKNINYRYEYIDKNKDYTANLTKENDINKGRTL